jgi:hypothetical protein
MMKTKENGGHSLEIRFGQFILDRTVCIVRNILGGTMAKSKP